MYGLFNDNFQPAIDGVGTVVYNYAMEMYKQGRDAHVVAPDAPGTCPLPEPFAVTRITSIPLPGRPPYTIGLPFLPTTSVREVWQTPFELIHCHAPFSMGRTGRLIARQRGIPFVASFRSKYWSDFYNATQSEFISDVMTKSVVHFYEDADQVWITDESVLEAMHEYGFRERKGQVVVVPNGIESVDEDWQELRHEKRAALGLDEDTAVFLFVGQQIRAKNIDLILDSLAHLKDTKFAFYSLGKGVDLEYFVQKAETLGLADVAHFQGQISDRRELFAYYAAADLFLFPSLYDTYGNVIREAALMHTPSLLVRGSTCAGPFQDGVDAFVAVSDDPEVYARKIRSVMKEQGRRERVGRHIAGTLSRSWEDVVSEVVDRYDALIYDKRCRHYYL